MFGSKWVSTIYIFTLMLIVEIANFTLFLTDLTTAGVYMLTNPCLLAAVALMVSEERWNLIFGGIFEEMGSFGKAATLTVFGTVVGLGAGIIGLIQVVSYG